MTLYEIDSAIGNYIAEHTDPETGELNDIDGLSELEMARDDKCEGIALYIKNMVAEVAAIKTEEQSLAERRRAKERKAEKLKAYLSEALAGQKFETPRCKCTFRKSAALEYADEAALVAWLESSGNDDCLTYAAPKISKKAVTDLIKRGVDVPDAEIVQRESLTVK